MIGASAGGFEALLAVLKGLPATYPMPLVAVLHLPENHDSRLAELFGYRLPLQVREARDKESLAPGTLYFAPSGLPPVDRERSQLLAQLRGSRELRAPVHRRAVRVGGRRLREVPGGNPAHRAQTTTAPRAWRACRLPVH